MRWRSKFIRAHAIIVLQSEHRNKITNLRLKIQTQKLNTKDLACKLYIQGRILFVLENTMREMISSKVKSQNEEYLVRTAVI